MSEDTPLFDLTMGRLLAKTAAAHPDNDALST
jgi:hypothetical protein